MNQFTVVLAVVLSIATLVPKIRTGNVLPDETFVEIVNRSCPSPDSVRTMSTEELKQDEDLRSSISEFVVTEPPIIQLVALEHLTGAEFLEAFNTDNYRENVCSAFLPIEPALNQYVLNRAKCLRNNLQFLLGFYRTICANDFEETITDVVRNVGDDCINNLLQLFRGTIQRNPDDIQACERTNDKYRELRGKTIAEFKKGYFEPLFKYCILNHIGNTCGAEAEAQFKRLSDRLLNAMTV